MPIPKRIKVDCMIDTGVICDDPQNAETTEEEVTIFFRTIFQKALDKSYEKTLAAYGIATPAKINYLQAKFDEVL